MVGKFPAVLDVGIIGVAHHDARGLEAGGGHAFETFAGQHGAHPIAQSLLFGADLVETVGLRLFHHFVKSREGIAGHGRMVGMSALFVGLHDLKPFFQVAGEAAALRLFDAPECQGAEHHQGAARGGAPAFLRCADQQVDCAFVHIDPKRARGDAVQHEQATHRMHGVADGPQVLVGQDNP